jgi:hypothetical protein
MALPTFIIIGAAKAGTTSLHYYLDLHPEIQMSAVKETNFFAGPPNGRDYELGQVASLEAYEELFDPAVPVRGEASPNYANDPIRAGAAERIKGLIPEAKIIYLVRDPVARTVSHYRHRVSVSGERRSLRQVLDDYREPSELGDTCMSLYASQLEGYLRCFPEERILVLDQAELLANRDAVLRSVFSFLAVDESFTSRHFSAEKLKSSERRTYPSGYNRFMRRAVAPAGRWIPPHVRHGLRRNAERYLFPPLPEPTLESDLRARLEQLYGGEVERLRALTGKEFATWSI